MAGTWELLGSASGGSGTMSVSFTTGQENLFVQFQQGTNVQAKIQYNDDDGSNQYSFRRDEDGTEQSVETTTYIRNWNSGSATQRMTVMQIANQQTKKKEAIHRVFETTSGADEIGNRMSGVSEWNNTTAKINKISFTALSGSFDSSDSMTVWGATGDVNEMDNLTNVPANTRFEATDTRKIFRNTILKDNCLAYYNFDSTSGGLVNQATTTNGFASGIGSSGDGTNTSITLDTSNEKLGTGCYDFDGSSSYVTFTTKFDVMQQKGSFSCWLKPENAHNNDIIFDNSNVSSANNGFSIRFEDPVSNKAVLRYGIWGATDGSIATGEIWTENEWQHLVTTYDGTTAKIFRNGTEVKSGALTANSSAATYNARFGWGANGNDNKYDGLMDDVGIWNVALSVDQISALYNSGTGKTVNTTNAWKERNTA